MSNAKKRVIIDTDPGVDDAFALVLALRSPELHIEAITTVNGNIDVYQGTENALRVNELMNLRPSPAVFKGADRPLRREPFPSVSVHGRDGLGEITFMKNRAGKKRYPPPRLKAASGYAPEVMCEAARRHSGELVIITLGPLTNVALALTIEPGLSRHVKEIVAMGGAYASPGNVTPAAEFNFFCDPEAVREVIGSGIPLTLVGLDVTRRARLSRSVLLNATRKKTRLNRFLRDSTERVMNFYREREGYHGCCLHDALAVMVAIDRSFVGTVRAHVDIETQGELTRGMSVADLRPIARERVGEPNAEVALHVDSNRFQQFLLDRITDR
ncbi:MAG: nucleoside hydrolase [Candidatus Abyssubacteria bacterium]